MCAFAGLARGDRSLDAGVGAGVNGSDGRTLGLVKLEGAVAVTGVARLASGRQL